MVSSFNDWIPIEMRTNHEIRLLRLKGEDTLETMDEKQRAKMGRNKKKEENIIRHVDFMPPGKHFFYFVYKNEYVFLSPNYDVVRFKGSSALVNTLVVKPRQD